MRVKSAHFENSKRNTQQCYKRADFIFITSNYTVIVSLSYFIINVNEAIKNRNHRLHILTIVKGVFGSWLKKWDLTHGTNARRRYVDILLSCRLVIISSCCFVMLGSCCILVLSPWCLIVTSCVLAIVILMFCHVVICCVVAWLRCFAIVIDQSHSKCINQPMNRCIIVW